MFSFTGLILFISLQVFTLSALRTNFLAAFVPCSLVPIEDICESHFCHCVDVTSVVSFRDKQICSSSPTLSLLSLGHTLTPAVSVFNGGHSVVSCGQQTTKTSSYFLLAMMPDLTAICS